MSEASQITPDLQPEIAASGKYASRLVVITSIVTAIFAVAGLLGHIPGLGLLGSISPDFIPMSPSAAICFLTLIFILLCNRHRPWRPYFLSITTGLVLLVIVFCLLGIIGQINGIDLNFEQRLFPVTGAVHGIPIGRMSPATGVAFFLAGMALLLLLWSRRYPDMSWMHNWASWLGGLTILISFIFLMGYLRGTPFMYNGSTIPMAATTSVAFHFLGTALAASVPPNTFPLRLVAGNSTSSRLLRQFLPLIIVVVSIGIMAPRYLSTPSEEHPDIVAFVMTIFILAAIATAAFFVSSSMGKKLDQANEKVTLLIEKGGDGVVVLQDGLLKFANSKAVEFTGLAKKDMLGKPFIDYVAPQYREIVVDRYRKRLAGEEIPDRYEMGLLHQNGSVIPVEVNACLIEYDGKPATLSMVRDITERKRLEEQLQAKTEALNKYFDEALDLLCIADTDGYFQRLNKEWEQTLGYKLSDLEGHRFLGFVHPDDLQATLDATSQLEAQKPVLNLINRYRCKNGSYRWLEWRAHSIGKEIYAVARDITEVKKIEAAVRTASTNFNALFESSNDAILVINVHDFTITSANKAFLKQAGLKEEPVIGRTCYEITHSRSAPCASPLSTCPLEETLITGKHSTTEHVHFTGNEKKYVKVSTTPIKDENGKITQVIHVSRDLTERRKLMEQIMSQDRLASIGQLVSGVAHELNNPLTSVIGFSELLLQRGLPDDIKADLKIVNDEAKRTSTIVKNLLTFARQQPQEKQAIDINEPIKTVLKLRSHEQITNNIAVNTHFAPDLPQIMGNVSQLQQVFFNLVVNAEQAMLTVHNKGSLTVTTEQTDNCIRVSFADNGPGISPENMEKLFTPFFTTKGVGNGTGLGLSVSHGIITEHDGKIYAESEPGKGATFVVELPVGEPA